DSIRVDLREWLRRASEDGSGYVPWRFELSFGLDDSHAQRRQADPHSTPNPIDLDSGMQLRGSIDLVQRHASGPIRIRYHKTGNERHLVVLAPFFLQTNPPLASDKVIVFDVHRNRRANACEAKNHESNQSAINSRREFVPCRLSDSPEQAKHDVLAVRLN